MGGDDQLKRKNKDYLPSGIGGSAASTAFPAMDYEEPLPLQYQPDPMRDAIIDALRRLGLTE